MTEGLFTSYNKDDFKAILKSCLLEITNTDQPPNACESSVSKSILTRQETAILLSISLPTLHDYSKRGLIPVYRLGNKVRYKIEDVQASLVLIKTSKR